MGILIRKHTKKSEQNGHTYQAYLLGNTHTHTHTKRAKWIHCESKQKKTHQEMHTHKNLRKIDIIIRKHIQEETTEEKREKNKRKIDIITVTHTKKSQQNGHKYQETQKFSAKWT